MPSSDGMVLVSFLATDGLYCRTWPLATTAQVAGVLRGDQRGIDSGQALESGPCSHPDRSLHAEPMAQVICPT